MTLKSEQIKVVRKIIVFFDIYSSTSVLEDLVRTENQKIWRDLLIDIQRFLLRKRVSVGFKLYKFLGDGWILLFEPRPEGLEIFNFLEALTDKFDALYKRRIKDVLTTRISFVGLKFGMDIGSCIQFIMNKQREYTGRPLNVAARLQGVVKQPGRTPRNKVLVSNNLYATFEDRREIQRQYRVRSTTRTLKNISGGDVYRCRELCLDLLRNS